MLIEGPVQGQTAILRYLLDRPAQTPPEVHTKLEELSLPQTTPSSVVGCIEAVEMIYARRSVLAPQLLGLGADLAEMIDRNRYQMGQGATGEAGRARAIAAVLRTMDGVDDDAEAPVLVEPEPKADYVPTAPAEPEAA